MSQRTRSYALSNIQELENETNRIFNELKEEMGIEVIVQLIHDNTQDPYTLNTRNGSTINIPIRFGVSIETLKNDTAHELSHVYMYNKLSDDIKEHHANHMDCCTLNYGGFHMIDEYNAYKNAEEYYPLDRGNVSRNEDNILKMFLKSSALLSRQLPQVSALSTRSNYLGYFDNIPKLYFIRKQKFKESCYCAHFIGNLYKYIEAMESRKQEEMSWKDYHDLFTEAVDALYHGASLEKKEDFIRNTSELMNSCIKELLDSEKGRRIHD